MLALWSVMMGALALAAGCVDALAQPHERARPSDWAACRAWDSHMNDLLDQHRTAGDLSDEEFGTAVHLIYEARHACGVGRFSEAFDTYSRVPLGRARRLALR